MLNSIKYDWLRRWKFFLAGIVVFLIVNADLIFHFVHKKDPNLMSAFFWALLFGLCVALVIDHMGRLYRSLFTDEGLLDFALPLNGYQFLGAKLLAVVFECIAVVLLGGTVLYFDLKYAESIYKNLHLPPLTGEIFIEIFQVAVLLIAGYLIFILMVYLSLALAKSIFAPLKHGKLVAFLCFLAIGKIMDVLSDILGISSSYIIHGPGVIIASTDWLVVAVSIIVLYTGTAYLLDRKVNL